MPRKRQITNANEEPLAKVAKKAKSDLIIDKLQVKEDALEILPSLDDVQIQDLLAQGGTGKEFLNIFIESVEKPKASEISTVFHACHLFLLYLSERLEQEEDENIESVNKFKKLGLELSREILEDHMGYVILLLSASNTVYQVKSSLKLLTAMVTFQPQTAKEVLNKVDFEHKHWESVWKRNSPEIRETLVQFLLSFFITNHPGIAKEFLDKKNILPQIFPGLIKDTVQLVELVLTTFKEKILENASLSKTSKMKLFSVYSLKLLLKLYNNWTGQHSDLEQGDFLQQKADIREILDEFFHTALTSTKHGVVFHDSTFGTSGSNMNHLLLNFLNAICEPWTQPTLAKLVIEALSTCPDQIRPYLNKTLQPLWEPRASQNWFQVIDFLYAIFEGLDVNKIMAEQGNHTKTLIAVVCNFFVNDKIFKEVIQSGMKMDEHIVKIRVLELLALFCKKLEPVLHRENSSNGRKQILFRLHEKLPQIQDLYSIWNIEVDKISIELDQDCSTQESKYLSALTQVISFYLNNYPERYCSSDLNLQMMLQKASQVDKEGNIFTC